MPSSIDLLLTNGRIYVGADFRRTVAALAVTGGRVSAIDTREVEIDTHTEIIDLKGNTVLPGFIDAAARILTAAPKGRVRPDQQIIENAAAFHRRGITSVHLTGHLEEEFTAVQRLWRDGRLPLRVFAGVPGSLVEAALSLGLHSGFGDNWLRIGTVRVAHEAGGGGTNDTVARAKRIASAGLALSICVSDGDTAEKVLELIESLPQAGCRHHVEWTTAPSTGLLKRLGKLPVVALAGSPDAGWLRTLRENGVRVLLGSGNDGASASVIERIDDAVSARDGLALADAIDGCTAAGAWATGEEGRKGTIDVGKLADFVVLSADPFLTPDLRTVEVLQTVIAGKTVYFRS